MKRWCLGLAMVALLGGGWLTRDLLFPGEVARLQRVFTELEAGVSFGPQEGNVAAIRRIAGVADRFAPDAGVEVEILGVGTIRLKGRDEIQQALMSARRPARRMVLHFYDLIFLVGEDGETARVHLTATADSEGYRRSQQSFEAIEFAVNLRKLDGRWRIQDVVTVPTLKQ